MTSDAVISINYPSLSSDELFLVPTKTTAAGNSIIFDPIFPTVPWWPPPAPELDPYPWFPLTYTQTSPYVPQKFRINAASHAVTYSIDVPGIAKENIDVSIVSRFLSVKGKRSDTGELISETIKIDDACNADPEMATGTYENGVLTVVIQKTKIASNCVMIR